MMRGLLASRNDWESLQAAERREHNFLLREARPGLFMLRRLLQITSLERTRAFRPVRRILTDSSSRCVESALRALVELDPELAGSIQKSFSVNEAEGIDRPRSTREEDANKAITRLLLYHILAQKNGPPLLCEQDSFWHKLIWLHDPEMFSMVPLPTAVVVLTSEDVAKVFEIRKSRGAAYDNRRLGHLNDEQQISLLLKEQELWADFASSCAMLDVPVLRIEAYGDLGDQVHRAATFFDQVIARVENQ